jgi:hypothetical protein
MVPLSSVFHLSTIAALFQTASSLGINCRGSGVCPLATFFSGAQNKGTAIIQGLRSALDQTTLPDTTEYSNGQHIVCVGSDLPISISISPGDSPVSVTLGGGVPIGGICAFLQSLPTGTTLTLAQIKTLTDDIINHDCKTCGSVPITYPDNENVDSVGELTYNFVSEENFTCDGTCISGTSNSG